MFKHQRLASLVCGAAAVAALSACGTYPNAYGTNNYPVQPMASTSYPNTAYPNASTNYVEYGRISNIEMVQGAVQGNNNGTTGTVIGGVLGAVVGNQIGHGSGRAAATVLGAVGGAVVGNQIARNSDGSYSGPAYRISVQTENGQWRSYDVGSTGDLRVGDRVRIENGVLYRS